MKLYIKSLVIILFPLVLFIVGSQGLTAINNWSAEPATKVFEILSQKGISGEVDEKIAKNEYGVDLATVSEEMNYRKKIRNGAVYIFIALMLFTLAVEAKWLSRNLNT